MLEKRENNDVLRKRSNCVYRGITDSGKRQLVPGANPMATLNNSAFLL